MWGLSVIYVIILSSVHDTSAWSVPVGSSYSPFCSSCLCLPDYDLCTPCMSNGGTEQHNPFHEFFDITVPGRTIVHTVFSGNSQCEAVSGPRHVPIPPPSHQTSSQETPTATVVAAHFATCNLCDSRIRGDRYVSIYLNFNRI